MDDAPQTRLALGPIEISLRRRGEDDVRRIGVPGSIVVHVVIFLAVLILAPYRTIPEESEAVIAAEPPVPVTFVNPFPPLAPVPEVRPAPPPPAGAKPLRMQAPPEETVAPVVESPPSETVREIGRNDKRPAGGESGGPLSSPASGFPGTPDARASSAAEPPKDLNGRLREFRRAQEAPLPGPKGGGKGSGGITMPDVSATGMGIGNLEFESRDYDWSSYARSIYWAIWRAWHNRMLASSGNFERWAAEHGREVIDARARIVFTIERSGQITGVAVVTPSGCYPFDDSATDALREVLLPPLPADFPRGQERVHATFLGEDINIRAMRTGLQWLKDRGVF